MPSRSQRASFEAMWLLAARVVRAASQFGLLIAIARLSGPGAAGNFALALAITAPLFVFAELGLRTIYLTMEQSHPFSRYGRIRWTTLAAAFAAVLCVSPFVTAVPTSLLVAVAAIKASESLGELSYGPFQKYGSVRTVSRPSILATVGGFALSLAILAGGGSLTLALLGCLAPSLVVNAVYIVPAASRIAAKREAASPDFPGERLRSPVRILTAGASVSLSTTLLTLTAAIPQYLLAAHFNAVTASRFAVALYAIVIAELALNAIVQTWIPRVVARRENGGLVAVQKSANAFTLRLSALFVPVAALCTAASVYLLPALMGSTYAMSATESLLIGGCILALPLLFVSSASMPVIQGYGQALTIGAAALILVSAGCYVAVPRWGVEGALAVNLAAIVFRGASAFSRLQYVARRASVRSFTREAL